jgi:DNA polymerase (family 10)
MAAGAAALGHRFLAITDHSRSAFYAGGLSAEHLARQGEEVREAEFAMDDLTLFHGVESDVLADGSLDYDDRDLARLDLVVASVHSRFGQDEATMTARIVRAVENPRTSILAHPTGRLLLAREPYAVDLEAVLAACARCRVAIELNASPQRLDLDWRWLRRAAELDVVVAINTDAHDVAGLADLEWGVAIARKAGLSRRGVLNAWEPGRIARFLGKS